MRPTITINGRCHCGNIDYELQWPADSLEIAVRECTCAFCSKHGGAWTSNSQAELSVAIKRSSFVSKYRFGTETADFYVCAQCGVVPLVVSLIDDQPHAVVNTNTFSENSKLSFSHSQSDFDGEDVCDRLKRRKQNWISNVRITLASC